MLEFSLQVCFLNSDQDVNVPLKSFLGLASETLLAKVDFFFSPVSGINTLSLPCFRCCPDAPRGRQLCSSALLAASAERASGSSSCVLPCLTVTQSLHLHGDFSKQTGEVVDLPAPGTSLPGGSLSPGCSAWKPRWLPDGLWAVDTLQPLCTAWARTSLVRKGPAQGPWKPSHPSRGQGISSACLFSPLPVELPLSQMRLSISAQLE